MLGYCDPPRRSLRPRELRRCASAAAQATASRPAFATAHRPPPHRETRTGCTHRPARLGRLPLVAAAHRRTESLIIGTLARPPAAAAALVAVVARAVQPQPEHGVYTVFVSLNNTKIELISPLGDASPIRGFLQKRPEGGIHHVCLEVDDIRTAVAQLKLKQIRALDPEPKIGAHGKLVVFLHPKVGAAAPKACRCTHDDPAGGQCQDCGGVLIELEEA